MKLSNIIKKNRDASCDNSLIEDKATRLDDDSLEGISGGIISRTSVKIGLPSDLTCSDCGQPIKAGKTFCENCGMPIH